MKRKLLIIDSIDDALTQRRHTRIFESGVVDQYEVSFCYGGNSIPSDQPWTEWAVDSCKDDDFTEDNLFTYLDQQFSATQPDVVLVHSGFIFRRWQGRFENALKRIKLKFPYVCFGFQARFGIEPDPQLYDKTGPVFELSENVFVHALR